MHVSVWCSLLATLFAIADACELWLWVVGAVWGRAAGHVARGDNVLACVCVYAFAVRLLTFGSQCVYACVFAHVGVLVRACLSVCIICRVYMLYPTHPTTYATARKM